MAQSKKAWVRAKHATVTAVKQRGSNVPAGFVVAMTDHKQAELRKASWADALDDDGSVITTSIRLKVPEATRALTFAAGLLDETAPKREDNPREWANAVVAKLRELAINGTAFPIGDEPKRPGAKDTGPSQDALWDGLLAGIPQDEAEAEEAAEA